MTKFGPFLFLIVILLNSCTIEKRKYTSGYHTTWNAQRIFPKGNDADKFETEKYSALRLTNKRNNTKNDIADDSLQHQQEYKNEITNEVATLKEEKAPTHISDTIPKKTEEFLSTLSPQSAPIARDYLEQTKRLIKARTGIFSSFAISILGLFIAADIDAAVAYIALLFGFVGVIVFGIIALVILTRKDLAYQDLKRSILYSTNASPSNETSINELMLLELDESIKYNNCKTLALGGVTFLTGIIDLFEIGALGYIISPLPIIFLSVSLIFFLILRLRKYILETKLKKMTT